MPECAIAGLVIAAMKARAGRLVGEAGMRSSTASTLGPAPMKGRPLARPLFVSFLFFASTQRACSANADPPDRRILDEQRAPADGRAGHDLRPAHSMKTRLQKSVTQAIQ